MDASVVRLKERIEAEIRDAERKVAAVNNQILGLRIALDIIEEAADAASRLPHRQQEQPQTGNTALELGME